MATPIAIKRMTRERKALEVPNDDYIVLFKDDNLLKFEAYVLAPSDTLYSHKFLKLRFEIPRDYPLTPPKCTFIQHSGGRIHPNLYTEGKVCLSILGTWSGEKWAFAMTCETVLITIRSLLDNKPYTHEPHQNDLPSYNAFVQYTTWRALLLDYLAHEREPVFVSFLQRYVAQQGDAMLAELATQAAANSSTRQFVSPYGGRQGSVVPNYQVLERELRDCVDGCRRGVRVEEQTGVVAVCDGTEIVRADGDGLDGGEGEGEHGEDEGEGEIEGEYEYESNQNHVAPEAPASQSIGTILGSFLGF